MLRRTRRLPHSAGPPIVLGRPKQAGQLVDGNPSFYPRDHTRIPLNARFGFRPVGGARAPALRILADQLVDLTKRGDTDARQHVANFLNDPLLVDKAFDEYPRRFKDMRGKYAMMTKLRTRRRVDGVVMYFIEFKNRDMSDCHKGEDYSSGPERFFLPPRIIESEKGVQRPPHLQLAFDRWASKFKTEEFTHWWRMRHAKLRYWGIRNVPHPMDVDPLWSEKEEEEWQNEMMATSDADGEFDLDAEEASSVGEGGSRR